MLLILHDLHLGTAAHLFCSWCKYCFNWSGSWSCWQVNVMPNHFVPTKSITWWSPKKWLCAVKYSSFSKIHYHLILQLYIWFLFLLSLCPLNNVIISFTKWTTSVRPWCQNPGGLFSGICREFQNIYAQGYCWLISINIVAWHLLRSKLAVSFCRSPSNATREEEYLQWSYICLLVYYLVGLQPLKKIQKTLMSKSVHAIT